MEIYYRIEEGLFDDNNYITIDLMEFQVKKRTLKGAWITRYGIGLGGDYGPRRFVLNGAGKRYAYPTVEAALESFIIRKTRQIIHLEKRLCIAKAALNATKLDGFRLDTPVPLQYI